jgi:hypothetical protein
LKIKILYPKNINDDTIKTILDNAAIDHHDNGGIYVTNYSVNFWMEIDEKRKLLTFNNYWNTKQDVDEIDILSFVNLANSTKLMLQFSYQAEMGRLSGCYTHPYSVGLIPTHVLKLAQRFPAIFEEIVDEGIAKGILQEPTSYQNDDDGEAADEAADDSTVH